MSRAACSLGGAASTKVRKEGSLRTESSCEEVTFLRRPGLLAAGQHRKEEAWPMKCSSMHTCRHATMSKVVKRRGDGGVPKSGNSSLGLRAWPT